MADPDRDHVMSFGDHLDELRRRAFLALAVPLPVAILAFFFVSSIRAILEHPLRVALRDAGLNDQMQTRSVTEMMGVDIKLSLVVAVVVSGPWIIWQLWKFVEPGLYEHERRFARLLVPGSFLLTIAGVLTLYFALLPLSLQVLVQYGLETRDNERPTLVVPAPDDTAPAPVTIPILDEMPKEVRLGQVWVLKQSRQLCVAVTFDGTTIDVMTTPLSKNAAYLQQFLIGEYIDFVLLMMLGIAVAFQMPLVILLLGWVGLVRVETLRRNRRMAIFVLAIVAAIVTPTSDFTSMMLMMLPLYLLYELGILLLIAVPPGAVAEGNIVKGFFRRLRDARSPNPASGKRRQGPAQTEQPERPLPPTVLPPQTSQTPRREPDGDADEDARGGGSL